MTLTLRSVIMFFDDVPCTLPFSQSQFIYCHGPLQKIYSITVAPRQSGLYGDRGGPHRPAICNTEGNIRGIKITQVITTHSCSVTS